MRRLEASRVQGEAFLAGNAQEALERLPVGVNSVGGLAFDLAAQEVEVDQGGQAEAASAVGVLNGKAPLSCVYTSLCAARKSSRREGSARPSSQSAAYPEDFGGYHLPPTAAIPGRAVPLASGVPLYPRDDVAHSLTERFR
jgi:hypothetical protein